MKAYLVHDNYADDPVTITVFAEDVNKAKKLAFGSPEIECADYIDLRVKRAKELDRYYDGKTKIWDWNNMKHRKVLVEVCDFACIEPDSTECMKCEAKESCREYEYFKDCGEI